MREHVKLKIDKMFQADVIDLAISEWASHIVVAPKEPNFTILRVLPET